MTRDEIQLELSACTLRPQDVSEEVRTALESDAELAQWHQRECAMDQALCRLFHSSGASSSPEAMKQRLQEALAQEAGSSSATLSSAPRRSSSGSFRSATNWLAAAAAIAIGLFAVRPWESGAPSSPWQSEAIALLDRIESGSTRLDHFSSDLAVLKTGLTDSGTPIPAENAMPKRFADVPLLGCKSCVVDGCSASVVCFRLGPDGDAHVVILDQLQPDIEGTADEPTMDTMGDWHVAKWVQDGKTYFLATRAPATELQKLFAILQRMSSTLGWA